MTGTDSRHRVSVIARWFTGAVMVIAAAALMVYALGQRAALQVQESRIGQLEQQITDLSTDQRLLAAIVAADTPTATAEPTGQPEPTATVAPPSAPGTQRVFGSVRRVAKRSYGWELQVDSAEYLTGTPAFSLASSLGKLTNSDGSFILDTSERITALKLLKDAKVSVATWPGEPKGASLISASELVRVLPGGTSESDKWEKAWFWLDVRDGYVLQVTQQRVE